METIPRVRNVIEGLLTFMFGVLFAYFTYPFFNSLLDAITGTAGIWDGWDTVRYLMWAGYIGLLVMWILAWPAYKMFIQEEPVQ